MSSRSQRGAPAHEEWRLSSSPAPRTVVLAQPKGAGRLGRRRPAPERPPAAYGEVGLEEPEGNNDDVFENPAWAKANLRSTGFICFRIRNKPQLGPLTREPSNRRRKWHGKENQNESENV